MNILVRFLAWLNRFITSVDTLGLLNSFKIFLISRYRHSNIKIFLPDGKPFEFRGKLDKGVVSHFYKEGYLIEDTHQNPIRHIIDAGANIGDETARFLFHYPEARIVAIEPEESNYSILEKNFESNKDQVHLVKAGLWPVKTNLKIIEGTSKESFNIVETSNPEESIEAITIPEIMEAMDWEWIDILKLDIEGAEYELFTKNFKKWIFKVNVFIFEVPDNDHPGTTQLIYKALSSHEYNSYVCGENLILIKAGLPWKLSKVVGFCKTKDLIRK